MPGPLKDARCSNEAQRASRVSLWSLRPLRPLPCVGARQSRGWWSLRGWNPPVLLLSVFLTSHFAITNQQCRETHVLVFLECFSAKVLFPWGGGGGGVLTERKRGNRPIKSQLREKTISPSARSTDSFIRK